MGQQDRNAAATPGELTRDQWRAMRRSFRHQLWAIRTPRADEPFEVWDARCRQASAERDLLISLAGRAAPALLPRSGPLPRSYARTEVARLLGLLRMWEPGTAAWMDTALRIGLRMAAARRSPLVMLRVGDIFNVRGRAVRVEAIGAGTPGGAYVRLRDTQGGDVLDMRRELAAPALSAFQRVVSPLTGTVDHLAFLSLDHIAAANVAQQMHARAAA